ncbi:group II intron reverse transcriptase/maturase [Sphingobacterium puteale]|uniref:Group II intron reverse transcriptase/maturase n=1 Tax=Sphingobacterium puteale TaxID=2420510 RepID=A0A420VPJ7_9SPHI|nr:group II intron reverse transcriptase/maturase [Sphingobacterium puteale]RKO68243.1 group II intron reverse transcriptase/maturase [Sphingobacterium puteale]
MTVNTNSATDAIATCMNWQTINWEACVMEVRKLQLRIARWEKLGNRRKVKALQWLLTHSFSAKCLAVKRVSQNRGHRSAGIDGIVMTSPKDKWDMLQSLKRRGYKSLPLKRVYILKSDGKQRRPLGLPCMKDRVMQALYTMALLPISEMKADWNSYGFRPERGTADAIEQLFIGLATKRASSWVLEGDIKSCFDLISHEWILDNIPMDKKILSQWLKSGFVESGKLFPTNHGTPQGGLASPTLANMVLDGIEDLIGRKFGSFKLDGDYSKQRKNPILFVRYADDFVVIGRTSEVLEHEVKPMIQSFLKERGLELSETKTKITQIHDGFDFLGQNIRKYRMRNGTEKLLIKPSKANIKTFLTSIRKIIRSARSMSQTELIRLLNPKIRGWAYYHRSVVSSEIFSAVDKEIWKALWKWSVRRHPNKGKRWIKSKYFHRIELRDWIFRAKIKEHGITVTDTLFFANNIAIIRHTKIKQQATPFDPAYERYFQERTSQKWRNNKSGKLKVMALWKRQRGICPVCLEKVTKLSNWVVYWHKNKLEGGSDRLDNLSLLHPKCARGNKPKFVIPHRSSQ